MASFVSVDGVNFEVAETETLIGRGGRELNDPPKIDVGPLRGGPTVSRQHVRVYKRVGQWYLRVEPEARNPTFVDGQRIMGGEEAPLADNSRVQMGDVVLTFRAPQEAPVQSSEMTMIDAVEGDGHANGAPAAAPTPPPIAAVTPVASPSPPSAKTGGAATTTPAARPPATANWPARLPSRPSVLSQLGTQEFKRVNPFRGLMIDEEAWADAHDYHRIQSRLHVLSAHGSGIIEGLEVIADPLVPNTLVIRPGVAFDPHGRALLVAQDRRLPVTAEQGATLYVVLRFHEELTQPQRFWNDLDEYTRVVEKSQVLVQPTPPVSPAIELARVQVAGPVRNAADPMAPNPGEIDLRFRERLAVRPRPELGVAQLVTGSDTAAPAVAHRNGIRFLLREIGLTTPYRPRWTGVFTLEDSLPSISLLVLSGEGDFTVSDAAASRLSTFLEQGGVIFADGCPDHGGQQFATAVNRLVERLGRKLQPIERWHPLLTARHVFTKPPTLGQKEATVVEGGGLILSSIDCGCAWQGGTEKQPLGREVIREALEFGVNAAVYARQRQRPLEVLDLEV